MCALVRSGVSDLHMVNLLRDPAARAQEPSPPPPSVIPQPDPSTAEQDHPQPSGKRESVILTTYYKESSIICLGAATGC